MRYSILFCLFIFCTKLVFAEENSLPCTKIIIEESLIIPTELALIPTYENINSALQYYNNDDVICLSNGKYQSISIDNFDPGASHLTIRSLNNLGAEITLSGYHGTGISIKNSRGITLQSLVIQGGLYGIVAEDSSDINILSNIVFNVGQEAIIIRPTVLGGMNYLIDNNTIFDTGITNNQYGEGIYVGDGSYNKVKKALVVKQTVSNVIISNNIISNTGNEAIDIKSNAYDVSIINNNINNIDLAFNAAITVATEASYASKGGYLIKGNIITDVSNRSGYRPIGIGVGHGNTYIIDNVVLSIDKSTIGICLFKTFINSAINNVLLKNNQFIGDGVSLNSECTGGTNANAPGFINETIQNFKGTEQNDTLIGTEQSDMIYGYKGEDRLFGGDGNDIIFGGAGRDRLVGEAGNDRLHGENPDGVNNNNNLYGGIGNDMLFGSTSWDYMVGGEGDDIYIFPEDFFGASINNGDSSPESIDIIRFDGLIYVSELSFYQHEDDLHIWVTEAHRKKVIIREWFSNPLQQIQKIETPYDSLSKMEINNLLISNKPFPQNVNTDPTIQ